MVPILHMLVPSGGLQARCMQEHCFKDAGIRDPHELTSFFETVANVVPQPPRYLTDPEDASDNEVDDADEQPVLDDTAEEPTDAVADVGGLSKRQKRAAARAAQQPKSKKRQKKGQQPSDASGSTQVCCCSSQLGAWLR